MLKAIGILLFALPVFLHAGNPQATEAAKYNDLIVARQDHITRALFDFGDVLGNTTDSLFAADALSLLVLKIEASTDSIQQLGTFHEDDALRQAALNLFAFYKKIIVEEYRKIVSLAFLPEDMSDTNYEIEAIVENISTQEFIQVNSFAAVQNAFASKYGFVLNPLIEGEAEN